MIQQRKSPVAPTSLAGKKSWDGEDVREALYADQDGKCYLCEVCTDHFFEVEHVQSRSNFPEKAFEWSNLFLCCRYCNARKGKDYDDIVSPCHTPCEEVFDIYIRPGSRLVEINILIPDIPGANKTRELLLRLHNGKKAGMRDVKERIFFEKFQESFSFFVIRLNKYKNSRTPENRAKVAELLTLDQPFLAAKLSVLRRLPELLEDFRQETCWNRVP